MKKTICLFMLVFLTLIFIPNNVYAQGGFPYIPQQGVSGFPIAPRVLEFESFEYVQEYERVKEYTVVYYIPYIVNKNIRHSDYFLVYKNPYPIARGRVSTSLSSYVLEEQVLQEDRTEFHFRVTIRNEIISEWYPTGDLTPFFEEDSKMYIGIDEQDAYQRGFNAGVKSITNKYTSYVFKWTLPFVSLVIISSVYIAFKKEWFKK